MVQPTTRERVDAFWSATLGVDAAGLHSPGVHVHPNPPDREAWRGIYVLAFDKAASVFAPADLLATLGPAVRDRDAEAVLGQDLWREVLGGAVKVAYGPVVHHYRDERRGLEELAEGRRINPLDAEALSALRGAVPGPEWASAGFAAHPSMLFGLFEDGRLLAAANLTSGPDAATDVGIVVHPDARGRGYSVRVAAAAARQALLMHGVARFRALASSPAMLAIAETLGFTEYGRNLALYLSD